MTAATTLPTYLLEMLVDPQDKQPLWYLATTSQLYNPRRHCLYAISANIAVLLDSEAKVLSEDEAHEFEKKLSEATLTGTNTKG
jgi:uncharacterized protein YbaR (Trm112 family)